MSRIRWGIIGLGGIADQFAQAMRMVPDGEIVAVGSRDSSRAAAFAERLGVPRSYGSYEDLVSDPEVDVVYVATPQARHQADTLLALSAGKHVLCEKPFALNAGQVERMTAAARGSGLFLMEALWSRFLPTYRALMALLADGVIGEPQVVEADFGFPISDPGHRLWDAELGGGALLDLGIYPLNLAAQVLGRSERIAAVGYIGATGVDEQVGAAIEYPKGGLAIVKASLRAPLSCTARIVGTRGRIELPAMMHCPSHLEVLTTNGLERHDHPIEGSGLRFQVLEVHRCLREAINESHVMPLSESLGLAQDMDAIRSQIGLVFPAEAGAR